MVARAGGGVSSGHVAFLDLDGTILDSAAGVVASMREAYAAVGIASPDEATLRSWIGPPVLRILERELGPQGDEVVQAANARFRAYFDEVGAGQSQVFAGMAEAMGEVAGAGTTIVVVTHKPLSLAEAALAQHELDGLVDAVHAPASPSVYEAKDDLFAQAIARARPRTAMAAGDRATDIEAAAMRGVGSIGVTWGFGTAEELLAAGARALAAHPAELPSLLAPRSAPA
jgi:phosphoglycolate phosphatase